MLFKNEVKDMETLIEVLSEIDELDGLDKIKVAVVAFIFDKNGNLILHRRGPGARDEIGKLQAIGGSVNGSDVNFREALNRELKEECGGAAEFEIDSFLAAQLDSKIDAHTNSLVNWIILAYKVNLVGGELINNEPDRCIGFEKNSLEGFLDDDVSTTAYNFIKEMLNN